MGLMSVINLYIQPKNTRVKVVEIALLAARTDLYHEQENLDENKKENDSNNVIV